jgi:dihydrofolate reductase
MRLKLIVAMCKNRGIGYHNDIPWKIKKDLIYFSNKTCGIYGKYLKCKETNKKDTSVHQENIKQDDNIKKNAIIMGKNTWLSLPKYPEPLRNRDNIILSSSILENSEEYLLKNETKMDSDLIMYFSSISRISYIMGFCNSSTEYPNLGNGVDASLEKHETYEMREINRNSFVKNNNTKYENKRYDELWIIGGSQIYNSFINENYKKDSNILINEFCITYIDKEYECDTFFPIIENMNLYYISSFSKCESIDEKSGLCIPVYYIVFTLIENTEEIQKRHVEIINYKGNGNDECTVKYYYYYSNKEDNIQYITNDNAELFSWCITEC